MTLQGYVFWLMRHRNFYSCAELQQIQTSRVLHCPRPKGRRAHVRRCTHLPSKAETFDHEFEPNSVAPRLDTPEQATNPHVCTADVEVATQTHPSAGEDHELSQLHSGVQRPNAPALQRRMQHAS